MAKLTGTNPDQVPTNADLGTMAYQDTNLFTMQQDTNGDFIVFRQGGTEAGVVSSSGGSLLVGEGSAGIKFNSGSTKIIPRGTNNQNVDGTIDLGGNGDAWKDLYLSGGVYLGGTGAANKLDDYEFGDYAGTPSLQSGSLTLYSGQDRFSYTKIGRMVHVNGRIRVLSVSSPSGYINIPLPFTASNLTDESEYSLISVATHGIGLPAGTISVFGETAPNSANAILLGQIDNAAWSTLNASNISAGDYITISGSYLTA